jgi:Holliday junction resolvase RusA-like endonuclease
VIRTDRLLFALKTGPDVVIYSLQIPSQPIRPFILNRRNTNELADSNSCDCGNDTCRKMALRLFDEEEMTITFTVPGIPRGQARHRTFFGKGIRREVDPSASLKDDFLKIAYEHKPDKPMEGPIELRLHFFFPRPKAHYLKRGLRDTAPWRHIGRPDIDNLIKFVQDSLNAVFFKDDSQIWKIECRKEYGDVPRTEVTIERMIDSL